MLIDWLVGHSILAPYDERFYNRRYFASRVMEVLLGH